MRVGVVLSVAMTAAMVLAVSAPEQDFKEAPVSISVVTAADLVAHRQATDASSQFQPVVAGGSTTQPDISITGIATRVVRVGDAQTYADLWADAFGIQETPEALTGPQGTLYGKPIATIRHPGNRDFYQGQTVVTTALMEVSGEDVATATVDNIDGIFEMSVAATWTGDQVLAESPQFDYDPLIGYGNVANWGAIGGSQFSGYAKYIDGGWNQFVEQLIRFDFSSQGGAFYVGWVLPGVPDTIGFTLSYADEPSLDALIAQHVSVADIGFTDFNDLDIGIGTTYADLDPETAEAVFSFTLSMKPGLTASGPAPTLPSTASTTDPPTAAPTTSRPAGASDTTSGSSVVSWILAFAFVFVVGVVVALTVRWKRRATNAGESVGTPVHAESDRAKKMRIALHGEHAGEIVLASHLRDFGGREPVEGWIAPAYGAIVQSMSDLGENRPASAWSERFYNVETGEVVLRGDEEFDELMEKLDQPRPVEWGDPDDPADGPIGMDTGPPIS